MNSSLVDLRCPDSLSNVREASWLVRFDHITGDRINHSVMKHSGPQLLQNKTHNIVFTPLSAALCSSYKSEPLNLLKWLGLTVLVDFYQRSWPNDQGINDSVSLFTFSGHPRVDLDLGALLCELACSFSHAQLTELLGRIQRTWERSLAAAQSTKCIQGLRYQSLLLSNVLLNTL